MNTGIYSTGLFDTAAVKRVESLRTIPTLGMATVAIQITRHLPGRDHGASVEIRSVPNVKVGLSTLLIK